MNKWTDGEGATADKADDVEWNKKNWCEVGRQEAQIRCNSWWLAEQMVCWHSLWANEEPVQPYPCQQQHDNTDGQAQQQPVPKVDAVAVRVNPEFKDSKHDPYMDWDIFISFLLLFSFSAAHAHTLSMCGAPLTGSGTLRRWGWATCRAACWCLRCWRSRRCRCTWLYKSSGPVEPCWEPQADIQQPAGQHRGRNSPSEAALVALLLGVAEEVVKVCCCRESCVSSSNSGIRNLD